MHHMLKKSNFINTPLHEKKNCKKVFQFTFTKINVSREKKTYSLLLFMRPTQANS